MGTPSAPVVVQDMAALDASLKTFLAQEVHSPATLAGYAEAWERWQMFCADRGFTEPLGAPITAFHALLCKHDQYEEQDDRNAAAWECARCVVVALTATGDTERRLLFAVSATSDSSVASQLDSHAAVLRREFSTLKVRWTHAAFEGDVLQLRGTPSEQATTRTALILSQQDGGFTHLRARAMVLLAWQIGLRSSDTDSSSEPCACGPWPCALPEVGPAPGHGASCAKSSSWRVTWPRTCVGESWRA